jgi:hypothetical protein
MTRVNVSSDSDARRRKIKAASAFAKAALLRHRRSIRFCEPAFTSLALVSYGFLALLRFFGGAPLSPPGACATRVHATSVRRAECTELAGNASCAASKWVEMISTMEEFTDLIDL